MLYIKDILILILDPFLGYDYYGGGEEDEKTLAYDENFNEGEQQSMVDEQFEVLTARDEKKSTVDAELYEHLLKEIKILHSTIAELKASVTQLIVQAENRVSVSQIVSVTSESNISTGNVSIPIDADLEKLKRLNIDIEKILVLESDFADFPEFKSPEVEMNVNQLSTTSFLDTMSIFWSSISSKVVKFGLRVTSDSWTFICFCLFVFGMLFFLFGTFYLCCKYVCCKYRLNKQKSIKELDIEANHYEEISLNKISDPFLWNTTCAQVLVNRDVGDPLPFVRKLERSTSLHSKLDKRPILSTFVSPPAPPSTPIPIPIPPPLPPKKSISLPNTPALRRRVAFTVEKPHESNCDNVFERKETSV